MNKNDFFLNHRLILTSFLCDEINSTTVLIDHAKHCTTGSAQDKLLNGVVYLFNSILTFMDYFNARFILVE